MRHCLLLLVCTLFSPAVHAQDLNQWARNLHARLDAYGGPIDEGEKDNRNSLGTGSVKQWLTNPGSVSVSPPGNTGTGSIRYNFTGRERQRDYKLGAHQATHYNNRSGYVTANYTFAFSGKVFITSVSKHGVPDRVGDAVVRHIRAQNDTVVSSLTFLDGFESDFETKGIEVTGEKPVEPESKAAESPPAKK